MRKALRRLLALLVILLFAFLVLLSSQLGLRGIIQVAEYVLPGHLTVGQATGHLLKTFRIKRLDYRVGEFHLRVKDFQLSWHPSQLLRQRVAIKQLSVQGVRLQIPAKQRKAVRHEVYDLPILSAEKLKLGFHLSLGTVHVIDFVETNSQGHPLLSVRDLTATGQLSNHHIRLRSVMSVEDPLGVTVHLSVDGSIRHYRYLMSLKGDAGAWDLRGVGGRRGTQLTIKTRNQGKNQISGQLSYAWFPKEKIQFNLDTKALELGRVSYLLPTVAHLKMVGKADAHRLFVDTTRVQIKSEGQALSGDMQLSYHSLNDLKLDMQLSAPGQQVTLHSSHLHHWDCRWHIDSRDISELYPGVAGQLQATGSIRGAFGQPHIVVSASGKELNVGNVNLRSLRADARVDASSQRRSHVNVAITGLSLNDTLFNEFTARAKGTLKRHDIRLHFSRPADTMSLHMAAGYGREVWRGQLLGMRFTVPQSGYWQLNDPAVFVWSPIERSLAKACWSGTGGRLCAAYSWKYHAGMRGDLEMKKFNLHGLNGEVPAWFNLTGYLSGHLHVDGDARQIKHIDGYFKTPESVMASVDQPKKIYLHNTYLKLMYDQQQLLSQVHVETNHDGYVVANVGVPSGDVFDVHHQSKLVGQVRVHLPDVSSFSMLMGNVDRFAGQVDGRFKLSGTLRHPAATGQLTANFPDISLVDQGLLLQKTTLLLKVVEQALTIDLSAHAEGGSASLKGKAQVDPDHVATDMTLIGDKMLFVNSPKYRLIGSPNMHIVTDGRQVKLTGEVALDGGRVTFNDFRSVSTLPHADITYVEKKQQKEKPYKLSTQLTFRIRSPIQLSVYGIHGKLTGELAVTDSPNQFLLASGELSVIDGYYNVYGERLHIAQGRFMYAKSAIENPAIHVEAVRHIGKIQGVLPSDGLGGGFLVGLRLTGTLSDFRTEFFSNPVSLSQEDIFSYLIFGRPNRSGSDNKLGLAWQAFTALNSRGERGFAQKLQQDWNITTLGIQTTQNIDPLGNLTDQDSAFVVGKYFGKHLYAEYSNSLETDLKTLTMQYFLTHHWMLQGSANAKGQGGDIIYSYALD